MKKLHRAILLAKIALHASGIEYTKEQLYELTIFNLK